MNILINSNFETGVYKLVSLLIPPPLWIFSPGHVASRFKIYDFLSYKALKQCTILEIEIFTHVLTYISGYISLIFKRPVTKLKPFKFASNLKNHISLTAFKSFFTLNGIFQFCFYHLYTIFKWYHFILHWITYKCIEIDKCDLRRLLANLKGFNYVTNF